ncbi:NYN domain-containing protein [Fuscibacter oryzae]|uniref:RNase NYN domain-containing protein n=1 Tax=Fuscibacter oryzae TaxID=2803939 RepID=A0A8J7SW35_9RHOB|nr:hypothetical protein [Fuscibacter oryzae]MBL4928494.1 hypothetical protein [Fuscibacter oryzae]
MKVLWFIAVWSAALLVAALSVPALSDYVMLAGPCLVASVYLMLRGLFLAPDAPKPDITKSGRPKAETAPEPRTGMARILPRRVPKKLPRWVVVDGSNVMHWDEGKPSLETLRLVLEELSARGFSPGVIFDANAGWKLHDRYVDDRSFARQLKLPEDTVLVVPKGVPADQYILESARDLKARVVTNDRFRDWAEHFPEVHDPDFLIRGGVRVGHVWLDETARV